jgi:hypothetical protein
MDQAVLQSAGQKRNDAQRREEERQQRVAAEAEEKRLADERLQQEKAEEQAKEQERIEAEQKAKADAQAKQKAELEAKSKADKEAQAKSAAEKKRQTQEKRDRDQREADLRARLEDEETRSSAGFQSLKASYVRAIQLHVEQRWYEPPGVAQGLSCTIYVTQIPGGEVVGMRFGTAMAARPCANPSRTPSGTLRPCLRRLSPRSLSARSSSCSRRRSPAVEVSPHSASMLAALAWPFEPASAQLTVQILKGMAESVPIAIVPLAWDGTGAVPYDVAATVQADLERSGRFRPLPRSQIVEQPHMAARWTRPTGAC